VSIADDMRLFDRLMVDVYAGPPTAKLTTCWCCGSRHKRPRLCPFCASERDPATKFIWNRAPAMKGKRMAIVLRKAVP